MTTDGDGCRRRREHRLQGVAGLQVGGGRDRKGGRRRRQGRRGRTTAEIHKWRSSLPRRHSGNTATAGEAPVGGGGPQEGSGVVRRRQEAEAAALDRTLALARFGSERRVGRMATDGGACSRGREHRTAEVRGCRKVAVRDTKGRRRRRRSTLGQGSSSSSSGDCGGRGGAPAARGRRGQHSPAAVGTGKPSRVGSGWWRQWRLRFQGCCLHPSRGYSNGSNKEQRLLWRRCSGDGTAGDHQRWSGHLPGTFQQQGRVHQGLGHQCQGGEGGKEKRGGEEALAGASRRPGVVGGGCGAQGR